MPSRKRSQRRPASPAVRATGRRDFIHLKDTTMTRNSQGATPRAEVYTRVTDRIIADLEQGVHPWFKPWSAENTTGRIVRPLRASGEPYKGINVLMLWGEAVASGYACPVWMTYKQASEFGGQVRKGERGALVVYADRMRRSETTDSGEEVEREIPFMKGYTVFNAEQVDGLPEHFTAAPSPALPAFERVAVAEKFTANTGADIRHGGSRAFYAIDADRVQLPPFESFKDAESYYATLLHELTHNAERRIMPYGRRNRRHGLCAYVSARHNLAGLPRGETGAVSYTH